MIGSILVPVDGSEIAEHALLCGATLAGKLALPLVALHVTVAGPTPAQLAAAQADLDRLIRAMPGDVRALLRGGNPATEIIAAARTLPGALIVMATHARAGFGRALHGSVADAVTRESGQSVLLIRSGVALDGLATIRRILVPLDGSSHAERALEPAEQLARAWSAELRLVRVADPARAAVAIAAPAIAGYGGEVASGLAPVADDSSIVAATDYLDDTADTLRRRGLVVRAQALAGDPVEELLAYERSCDADLVAIASHGRGGVARLVLGSTAEQLVRRGTAPVLVVPAHDVRATDA